MTRIELGEQRSFPDPEYEENYLIPLARKTHELLSDAISDVLMAHILDLIDAKSVSRADGIRGLVALTDLAKSQPLPEHPIAGLERVIIDAGSANVLLGRSREDVVRTAARIVIRERLLSFADALNELRQQLQQLATGHLQTLIVATAGGQTVQPTTLAHYLVSKIGPLERTNQRLQASFNRVNQSPLGALSGTSTSIPVRRESTATLLGFDTIVENTFDAISSTDAELEVLQVVSLVLIDLARFVSDLSYWARDDVGVVTPGREFVHANDAQPQRRDPQVLRYLRIEFAKLIDSTAAHQALIDEQTMLGHELAHLNLFLDVIQVITAAVRAVKLLSRVVSTLEVERALSANRTQRLFATSSDLADFFAIDHQIPRDQAYLLATKVIAEATKTGLNAMTLTPEFIDSVALKEIGAELGIEPEDLGRCLAPRRFIERRSGTGGPAPSAVRKSLEQLSERWEKDRAWIDQRQGELTRAMTLLRSKRNELLG